MSEELTSGNAAVATLPAAQPAKQPSPISVGARGLELRSLEDAWRFASSLSRSGLAPKGVESPEAILVAMQMGFELGLPPMAAIQNVAVINGRPSLWGDAMLAVVRSSGLFDEEAFEEQLSPDGRTASCTVRRLPKGRPITRTFALDDAKLAGLLGKPGPWSQYPRRMLQMRARSWALRDAFSDVLRGMLTREEAADIGHVEIESAPARPTTLDGLADTIKGRAAAPRPVAGPPAPAIPTLPKATVEQTSPPVAQPKPAEREQEALLAEYARRIDAAPSEQVLRDLLAEAKGNDALAEETWTRVWEHGNRRLVQMRPAGSRKSAAKTQKDLIDTTASATEAGH